MATTEEGDLNIIAVTNSQNNKPQSFNGHVSRLEKAATGMILFDAGGLSGTQVLTEAQSEDNAINIFGSKSSTMTLEVSDLIKQDFMIRDETTDANAVTFQPTGGSGVVLPKNRWIRVRVRTSTVEHMGGWMDESEAAALSFAGNWRVVSGRALTVSKSDGEAGAAGGLVHLQGAVENASGGPPAAGNTIVTLPAGYRPAHTVAFVVVAEAETPANADAILVEITTGGAVIILNLGAAPWTAADLAAIDLSGITFFAGN